MIDTVVGVATLVITALTWADEVTWGYEHIPHFIFWATAKTPRQAGIKYRHNPIRNYRVDAPDRLI